MFPADDRDLLQLLEVRANNGGVKTVETVYVLTGRTYFVPERLFAFDDPALYQRADPAYVAVDNRTMAETIRRFYADQPGPRVIVRVHTHPGGPASPSEQDYRVATSRQQLFDRYFDDYELFLGIHALTDECTPDAEWIRRPEQTAENEVSWWGENRKHKLAIYDGAYNPRPVLVEAAAAIQQTLPPQAGQQAHGTGGDRPQPGSEPGGEIWD